MRVDTLEAYNIAPDILAVWRSSVGSELLSVQERAVKEFGLFGGGNLIVFSPTSSGKTFVGEMAAVKAARENTKVFYLVPQKALAEEKFQEFRQRYGSLGIKVVVSSRDHREYDDDIERRDFQIAVVVFEKMQTLLVSRPQLTEVVGLVVIDELQLITDETRGPTLELLLTKLRTAHSTPRIVGLSAVLGKAQSLADWLGAKLLIETKRPVELRKGVLCKGEFKFLEHNSSTKGAEAFVDYNTDKRHELVLGAAEELARRKEQVLVFLPDRMSTVTYARMLNERVSLSAAEEAIEELREHEETHAREALLQVLSNSIAFHNSDLSPEERSVVEKHFRSGAIRVLFSTSTLAMGLNLPVKNVILDGKRWQYLKRYSRWSLEDVTKSEYENMSGRAGRLAHTNDFGRSILVTHSPFEADVWLRHYVGAEFEDIVPTLKEAPLENHVLNLLASGLAESRNELAQLLLSSFTGFVHWNQQMSREGFLAALDAALKICLDGGLARRDTSSRVAITDLGRACASKGVDVSTGVALAEWAKEAKSAAVTELEMLIVVSQSPAGGAVYVGMDKRERFQHDYRGELLRRAGELRVSTRPVFASMEADQSSAEFEAAKAFKKSVLLADWIDEVRTKDIERKYSVWAGALRRLGEEYAWLVEALSAVAQACGWSDPRCKEISTLADRLVHGVRGDAVSICGLRVNGLGRSLVRRIVSAGFSSPDAMRKADEETLRKAVNHKRVFPALAAKLKEKPAPSPLHAQYEYSIPSIMMLAAAESAEPYSEAPTAEIAAPILLSVPPPQLIVDLRQRRIVYRGKEVPTKPPNNVQRQPLLALAVMATKPRDVWTMAELADGMHRMGGLRSRPVAPDAKDLRYKLLHPFKKAFATSEWESEVSRLFENMPGVGLRLNIEGAAHIIPLN